MNICNYLETSIQSIGIFCLLYLFAHTRGFVLHQKGARHFSRCVGRNEQNQRSESARRHAQSSSVQVYIFTKVSPLMGINISLKPCAVLLTICVRRALIMFTGMHIQFISLVMNFYFPPNARWGRRVRHRGGLFLPGGDF